MIDSMARAGAVLEDSRYLEAASSAANFILTELRDEQDNLLHTWRGGVAKLNAYLDDYVCLANALVSLYEATFVERWIEEAVALVEIVLEKFLDKENGGFFFTASDHEGLITRNKEFTDASTPGSNGMAATALFRLGSLLGNNKYLETAGQTLQCAGELMQRVPQAASQLLITLDHQLGQTRELVLVYEQDIAELNTVLRELHGRFLPNCVLAVRQIPASSNQKTSNLLDPAFAGKTVIDGQPTLYVCENFACQKPVSGMNAIREKLDELAN